MSSDSTYCTNCDRNFVNRTAIEAHFRESSAHTGLWCQRCQRHFAQAAHRDQHVMDSDSHWSCHSYSQVDGLCHFDGCSQESLHKHWRETEHHKFCEECDLDYLTQAQLHQHDLEAVSKALGDLVFILLTRTIAFNFKAASVRGPRTSTTFNNTSSA